MNRKLLLLLMLAGCASSDGGDPESASDDITPQEIAAGEATPAVGDSDSADPESEPVVTTPEEDSASFLDPEEAHLEALSPHELDVDPDGTVQTAKCHRAAGYRSGRRITICVTKIDGKYVEVNTARAYLRMRKAARTVGVSLYVVSGFRSMASQRYLYHCYQTKKCNGGNLAAPPGYSNHQSGHALDLNTAAGGVYSWLSNHGHTYGFRRTVPSEKWHWEH